jgi:hypothetical protein
MTTAQVIELYLHVVMPDLKNSPRRLPADVINAMLPKPSGKQQPNAAGVAGVAVVGGMGLGSTAYLLWVFAF